MAGDTLRGIGKKELAESIDPPPERSTEPPGPAAVPEELGPTAAIPEAPLAAAEASPGLSPGLPVVTVVEPAQDAEARPLRSLDDLPSDRTGRPAAATEAPVDDAAPLTSTSSTPRSGPNRVSFGTMIGHEMHSVQVRIAAAAMAAEGDPALRGTAHGHDVHLAASPGMNAEHESAPLSAPAPVPMSSAAPHGNATSPAGAPVAGHHHASSTSHDDHNAFSGGDHTFFETDPVNDEYEPESTRAPIYRRLAVSGAVFAVVVVVVVAWIHSHSTGEEPASTAVKTLTAPARAAPPPAAARREVPPTSTIPSSMPEPIPQPANVAKAPPPAALPLPAHENKVAASPTPVTVVREPKPSPPPHAAAREVPRDSRERKPPVAAATPPRAPTPPPPPRAAPPAPKVTPPPAARASKPEPARPVAHTAAPAAPAKGQKSPAARGKQKYDPDGTLPLSFD